MYLQIARAWSDVGSRVYDTCVCVCVCTLRAKMGRTYHTRARRECVSLSRVPIVSYSARTSIPRSRFFIGLTLNNTYTHTYIYRTAPTDIVCRRPVWSRRVRLLLYAAAPAERLTTFTLNVHYIYIYRENE